MICGSHYVCSYTMWCFPDNFFLLSVFGSLKKTTNKRWGPHLHVWQEGASVCQRVQRSYKAYHADQKMRKKGKEVY